MSDRLINGSKVYDLIRKKGIQRELVAVKMEICLATLMKIINTGVLPKRQRQWRTQVLAQTLGVSIDEILMPESKQRTA